MNETVVFTQHKKLLSPLELVCLSGSQKGQRTALACGRMTFGRTDENDIVLSDDTVSKHHGVLLYNDEEKVLFYDTASCNGISTEGKKAPVITLKAGQEIQIGSVYLKLVRRGQGIDESSPPSVSFPTSWKKIGLFVSGTTVFLAILIVGGFSLMRFQKQAPVLATSAVATPVIATPAMSRPLISTPHISQRETHHHSLRKLSRRQPLPVPEPAKNVMNSVNTGELESKAEAAFAQNDFQQAYSLWKQVLSQDPSNSPAQEGLAKLEKVAGQFYEDALMTQGSSPAASKEKLQTAEAISDPGSEIHAQAQKLAGNGVD